MPFPLGYSLQYTLLTSAELTELVYWATICYFTHTTIWSKMAEGNPKAAFIKITTL